jgi:hypothetical protein
VTNESPRLMTTSMSSARPVRPSRGNRELPGIGVTGHETEPLHRNYSHTFENIMRCLPPLPLNLVSNRIISVLYHANEKRGNTSERTSLSSGNGC